MEIADVFVVNKADRDGADRMLAELRMLAHIHPRHEWWEAPVLATQAHQNVGIVELYDAISQHRQRLEETGYLSQRRSEQRRKELLELLQHHLLQRLMVELDHDEGLQKLLSKVQESVVDPYTAAQNILDRGIYNRQPSTVNRDDELLSTAPHKRG
jgi:LAO/AO transport system kinase